MSNLRGRPPAGTVSPHTAYVLHLLATTPDPLWVNALTKKGLRAGAAYDIMARLRERGWVTSESAPPRILYRLTDLGHAMAERHASDETPWLI